METLSLSLVMGGVALCSLGLLPLLEVIYAISRATSSEVLLALSILDTSAMILSILFAAVGGAVLALHWTNMSVNGAIRISKLLAAALAVGIVADSAFLACVASHRQLDTPWPAEIYADHESLFEHRINDVFCHAKGLQICELGSVAEGRQIFPLQNWPVDSNRAPGRRIATSCEGFKDFVQLWNYPKKMELCILCGNITMHEEQLQLEIGAKGVEQVLAAVAVLSLGELQWCGEYLVLRQLDHDVGHSPYWKHRREFRALLAYDKSPCTLLLVVQVLQLLEVVATLSCAALVRWTWTLHVARLEQRNDADKLGVL
ncbi:hypothetical protein PsorP6_018645 [Peronosclerospora sorghi]|nr:hypothetical protein PsorP6_018645 [Peronosclerospora sorghi]